MSNQEVSSEQRQQIIELLIAGRKIEAIKQYRDITGEGLKESKEFMDQLMRELSKDNPDLFKSQGSGCSTAAALILGVFALFLWLV